MSTLRDRIRENTTRRIKRVDDVPELGTVYVRSLTIAEVETADDVAEMLLAAVCDAEGNAEFTADDLPMLRDLDARVARPLVEQMNRHVLPSIEDAKKN